MKNTAGDLMTIADLVDELPAAKPNFFEAKGTTGAGTKPAAGGGAVPSGKKRSEMSTKDKAAFVATHGRDAFLQLPA